MKKITFLILTDLLLVFSVGCTLYETDGKDNDREINTITDFSKFSDMTRQTERIEVEFDNYSGAPYYFTIEKQEDIDEIMDIIFSSSFTRLGKEMNAGDHTSITIVQGEKEYHIHSFMNKEGQYYYSFSTTDLQTKLQEIARKAGAFGTQTPKKLVELDKYDTMTVEGTTKIQAVYDYIKGEFTTYEFVITEQESIEKIMAEVFNIELKDYPEDQDIDFYQCLITVYQGDNKYYVNLAYASDESGMYLCQSKNVCEIIEKYIEDNLIQ